MAIPSNADSKRLQGTQVQPKQRRRKPVMTIEAMKQMVEALEDINSLLTTMTGATFTKLEVAVKAGRQAIAEAEKQEPVACQHKRYSIDVHEQIGTCIDCGSEGRMRFVVDDTHPQPNVTTSDMKPEHVDKTAKQRHEWVGLDEDEITQEVGDSQALRDIIRNIEHKLKEKNT